MDLYDVFMCWGKTLSVFPPLSYHISQHSTFVTPKGTSISPYQPASDATAVVTSQVL